MDSKVDKVNREELESFLRNVPNPVLLGLFGENCSPCEEMEEEIGKKILPEGVAFAKAVLGNEAEDIEIADRLALETFPTVIGFCQGEEVGRTSDPQEIDALLDNVRRCKESGNDRPAS